MGTPLDIVAPQGSKIPALKRSWDLVGAEWFVVGPPRQDPSANDDNETLDNCSEECECTVHR